MKKYALPAALLLTGSAFFWSRSVVLRSAEARSESNPERVVRAVASPKTTVAARTQPDIELQSDAKQALKAAPAASASEGARALGRMYDELSELLEASYDDCDALAYGVATIIEQTPPEAWEARLPSGEPSRAEALTRQVERMRSAFGKALPACSAQLVPEFAKLNRNAQAEP
jgi:hypothetical protein